MTNPTQFSIVESRGEALPAPQTNQNRGARLLRIAGALLLACILIGSAQDASATMKPEASGIYALLFGAAGTGKIDLTGNVLLDNANVDGFRYKASPAGLPPPAGSTPPHPSFTNTPIWRLRLRPRDTQASLRPTPISAPPTSLVRSA